MSETDLVRSVVQRLQLLGVLCWRANSGTVVVGSGKSRGVVRGSPAGTPDVLLVLPGGGGVLAGIELKTKEGRVLATQQRWANRVRPHGVRWGVARSVAEAVDLVQKWAAEVAPRA